MEISDLNLLKGMLRIRLFEEKVAKLVSEGEIKTPCHLYIGQEAIAVGVCSCLDKKDVIFSTHRSHGHFLAKGGSMKNLMAELYGRSFGCSHGYGGSMHLCDPSVGFYGSSAIVAGSIPLAVGVALAFKLRKEDKVAVTFFGDGATNEGVFYESLNFAALKKLPVIFICENNFYATHLSIEESLADTDIHKKGEALGVYSVQIDGNDVRKVYAETQKAVLRAKNGEGPTLIECLTFRWRGHVGPNDDINKGLRSQEELDYWKKKCPIKIIENYKLRLRKNFLKLQINSEIKEAVKFAKDKLC